MTVDVSQFHQVFFVESLEHLEHMESAVLQLDAGITDPEVINIIFRGAHSIKGGSGTFGFQEVAKFTHLLETLLERIRSGVIAIAPSNISVLLESVDMLREMIIALQSGSEHDAARCSVLQEQLREMLDADVSAAPSDPANAPAPAAAEIAVEAQWRIHFRPHPHLFRTGNDPYRILRELSSLGEVMLECDVSGVPSFAEMDPEECYLSWDLVVRGNITRADIDEIFAWVEGDCDLKIEPVAERPTANASDTDSAPRTGTSPGNAPGAAGAERRTGQDRRRPEGESIRVSIDKIDAIINMVGELVITQSMLSQVGTEVQELDGTALECLRDGLSQLERNTRELQEGVMRIRMLPISFAFSRFPRLVRDLGNKLAKKVALKISGEQTELDKTVMEKIGDPLVHLVRNSLDHGIEIPETRRSRGKPEEGQIHLNAYHQGGNIVIEVIDDGAGLDQDRILAKARERGLLPEDGTPDEDRILDLIFEPGFSTAETVTDVSGRGVGMDVVRRNVRDLGGNVEVSSRPGQGSTFTIRLPLTLAILDGQLVRLGGQVYIAPLVSIVESLQVHADRINAVAGKAKVYRLRDDYIPIIDLHGLFGVDTDHADFSGSLLVVVEAEGKKVGLVVDELLGQQQVVIKSLESNYRPVAGISGATILGDGTVALIIDAGQLVNMTCRDAALAEYMAGKVTAAA